MSYEREAARVWLLPFPPLCRPPFIGPASELLRDVSFTLSLFFWFQRNHRQSRIAADYCKSFFALPFCADFHSCVPRMYVGQPWHRYLKYVTPVRIRPTKAFGPQFFASISSFFPAPLPLPPFLPGSHPKQCLWA